MRRIPALLFAAGLAAAPASAVAGPSNDPWSTSQIVEKVEWSASKGRLGVMVMSLTPELRKHLKAPDDRGVLVARVDPGSPAAMAGISVGDVIVDIHGRKIETAPDVLSALASLGKGERAKIELVRDGQRRSLDATMTSASAPWPSWLRKWMKPDAHPMFATPFDDSWFRDWLKPFEQTKSADPETPEWLRKLRAMFVPNSTAPVCHRS